IAAELVGQPGIRIRAHKRVSDARDLRDVRAHLSRAERAIEADREWRSMPHRSPESSRGLAAEEPSRAIGDRARDHHRDGEAARLEHIRYGGDRHFGVGRVETLLDE